MQRAQKSFSTNIVSTSVASQHQTRKAHAHYYQLCTRLFGLRRKRVGENFGVGKRQTGSRVVAFTRCVSILEIHLLACEGYEPSTRRQFHGTYIRTDSRDLQDCEFLPRALNATARIFGFKTFASFFPNSSHTTTQLAPSLAEARPAHNKNSVRRVRHKSAPQAPLRRAPNVCGNPSRSSQSSLPILE